MYHMMQYPFTGFLDKLHIDFSIEITAHFRRFQFKTAALVFFNRSHAFLILVTDIPFIGLSIST